MTSQAWIQELEEAHQKNQVLIANQLMNLSTETYNKKLDPESWSVLECLEHLNIYARYYQPTIKAAIQKANNTSPTTAYKSGWFGKISIDGVRPNNPKKNKTLKKYNTLQSKLDQGVLEEFLQHQKQWTAIIKAAKQVNLNKRLVPVEFLRVVKLKIGDGLAFALWHETRHIQQALRVINS